MAAKRALRSVPRPGVGTSWTDATESFLCRDLAPGTRRVYRLRDRKQITSSMRLLAQGSLA